MKLTSTNLRHLDAAVARLDALTTTHAGTLAHGAPDETALFSLAHDTMHELVLGSGILEDVHVASGPEPFWAWLRIRDDLGSMREDFGAAGVDGARSATQQLGADLRAIRGSVEALRAAGRAADTAAERGARFDTAALTR